LVAGVGGMRALRAMGIFPGVYHLNEGHSAFATLEAIRTRMKDDGMSFDSALRDVAQHTVFTTHTPVPAGHDRFDRNLIEEHLGPLRDELGISPEQLMGLGRVEPQNEYETFCMTVLGLKLSRRANAVSNLHGHVTRRMWAHLWPWRVEEEIPIGHITNGVHIQSWLAWQMQQLYDRYFPADWMRRMGEPDVWQMIREIDPGELWETHYALKNLLLAFVRRRVSRQCRRRGESDDAVEAARNILDPNILTIGFARRFATYKRSTMILFDPDQLDKLVNDPNRPIQIIFAGKAHPADEPGKQLIQKIANLRHDPRFANRIAFLEDYDINVCRHMIQGVDVWLNNPRRPLEASGTSGQKAVLNGALNLSILDGWWAEAYDGANGFAIGKGTAHVDDRVTDARDAADLYRTLTDEVIPLYYDRDIDGLPRHWIRRMMNSISSLAWRFSADRMVADYVHHAYLPAAGGLSCDMNVR
jgi:starch phosphorylase